MANKKDSLGDRMKKNYEERYKIALTRRSPVIIRLDGKAFHTFTKNFDRPYDEVLHYAMNETTRRLCENIQGCKLGYTQSDEISLLLTDFDTITTDAWFDYELQKMCSIAASMATLYFNKALAVAVNAEMSPDMPQARYKALDNALNKGALFDARAFNIPEDEVANYFIWRQQDATRNAIQMLGQTHFSHNELNKKTCSMIQEMLYQEKGINFNDMPTAFKRGICIIKVEKSSIFIDAKTNNFVQDGPIRKVWEIDTEIPIFTQNRAYIESRITRSYNA